uniref:Variant surface glycoprotein 731 n=1 Tax=Trypanosoma brucei TaxID=5691 RepID=M4SV76_9TRYP|nr:variant surface glycoprotein 731 [Trypanosoma brucei]
MPRNVPNQKQLVTAVAMLIVVLDHAHASSPAFDEQHIGTLCKVASALTGVEGVARAKTDLLINEMSAASEAAAKLTLAALKASDDNSTRVFGAAAIAAQQCGRNAAEALKNLAGTALNAVANAAKTAGHISEIFDMLRQASVGRSTRKCIVQKGGTTQTTAKSVTDYGCPPPVLKMAKASDSPDGAQITDKGFPTLTFALNLHSSNARSTCIFLKSTNDDANGLWQASGASAGTALKLAQGFITITPHGTATSETAVLTQLDSFASSWQKESPSDTPQHVYNKIGALMKLTHGGCGTTTNEVLDTVLLPEKLVPILSPLFKDQEGKTAAAAVSNLINNAAGAATQQASKLKTKIDATITDKISKGEKTPTPLSKLGGAAAMDNSLVAAFSDLKKTQESTRSCAQSDANPEKQASEEANKECSGKKGDECKGRCGLVGDTCKPVKKGERENKKKDEGTASTCTGKLEDASKKDTGCKWENNACRIPVLLSIRNLL